MKQFTNLYQVSKTLRFELQPKGRTKETFDEWLKRINSSDDVNNLFAKDKKIAEAYVALKSVMDRLHEQFIEKSLLSEEAKKIVFSEYFALFRDKDKEIPAELEKGLRVKIGVTYQVAGKYFTEQISKYKQFTEKEIDKIKKEPYRCITYAKIHDYLMAKVKDMAKACGLKEDDLRKHLTRFKKYWGYLDGYNQNRENYYEFEKEASTAIATRIVHENLPTFCSNAVRFDRRKEEYLNIYKYLKDNQRETKIKTHKVKKSKRKLLVKLFFKLSTLTNAFLSHRLKNITALLVTTIL